MFQFPFCQCQLRAFGRGVRVLSALVTGSVCLNANAALPQRAGIGVSAVVLSSCRITSTSATSTTTTATPSGHAKTNGPSVGSSCNTSAPVQAYVRDSSQIGTQHAAPESHTNAPANRRAVAGVRVVQYVLDY